MSRFSAQVEAVLRAVGWYPGRQVPDLVAEWQSTLMASDKFEMFPSAKRALLEFGGLSIDQRGPGVTCAREPFIFNPLLVRGESDRFDEFEGLLKTRLYPLGEAVGGHCFWALGENEHAYLIMEDVRLVGRSLDEALENLILGICSTDISEASTK